MKSEAARPTEFVSRQISGIETVSEVDRGKPTKSYSPHSLEPTFIKLHGSDDFLWFLGIANKKVYQKQIVVP